MHRKDAERRRARALRAQGASVRAIATQLGVAKSSVSVWVRDVVVRVPPTPPPAPPVASREEEGPPERVCSRCRRLLPLAAFNRLGDGRQYYCRDCFREYFEARGDAHRAMSAQAKAARIVRARGVVLGRLRANPCVDCGETDCRVLEFDHVAGKAADISRLVADGAPVAVLRAELDRCVVRCANCHRRVEALRAASWRRRDLDDPRRALAPRVRRNLGFVQTWLAATGCVDCGERDIAVLEFDHVRGKRTEVMRLVWGQASLATLSAEVDRCEVRCANCHRRVTRARAARVSPAATVASPP